MLPVSKASVVSRPLAWLKSRKSYQIYLMTNSLNKILNNRVHVCNIKINYGGF